MKENCVTGQTQLFVQSRIVLVTGINLLPYFKMGDYSESTKRWDPGIQDPEEGFRK